MSFTYKVTFRNLFRYKRRFWMTVIGVAGCTALLLTGFGISDSINGIIVKQFTDVSQYGPDNSRDRLPEHPVRPGV